MKTVADFKRALKPGARIHTIHHQSFLHHHETTGKPCYGIKDLGVSTIGSVKSTQFSVMRTKSDGITKYESWCSFPKASECYFENGGITICEKDRDGQLKAILTYKILD